MAPLLIIWITIQLIVVSYLDVKTKKISNFWVILNLISFIPVKIIFFPQVPFKLDYFIFPLIFFIVGLFLFYLKVMGAGDSKFLSSFFLLLPEKQQEVLMESLLWVTVIIAGGLLIRNTIKNYAAIKKSIRRRSFWDFNKFFGNKIPFAPVILIAWIVFLLRV